MSKEENDKLNLWCTLLCKKLKVLNRNGACDKIEGETDDILEDFCQAIVQELENIENEKDELNKKLDAIKNKKVKKPIKAGSKRKHQESPQKILNDDAEMVLVPVERNDLRNEINKVHKTPQKSYNLLQLAEKAFGVVNKAVEDAGIQEGTESNSEEDDCESDDMEMDVDENSDEDVIDDEEIADNDEEMTAENDGGDEQNVMDIGQTLNEENANVLPVENDSEEINEDHNDDDLYYLDGLEQHQVSLQTTDFARFYQEFSVQPKFPKKAILNPVMEEEEETPVFYLLAIPEMKKPGLIKKIKNLGGKVVDDLALASRVVFFPASKEYDPKSLITLKIAAFGGRYLLPILYIYDSYDSVTFMDPDDYSSYEFLESKFDLHATTLAAIKMSENHRELYSKESFPWLHGYHVLFAEPAGCHEDVKLFLRVSGAIVNHLHSSKDQIANKFFSFIVTSGKFKLPRVKPTSRFTPAALKNKLEEIFMEFMS